MVEDPLAEPLRQSIVECFWQDCPFDSRKRSFGFMVPLRDAFEGTWFSGEFGMLSRGGQAIGHAWGPAVNLPRREVGGNVPANLELARLRWYFELEAAERRGGG